ncbi:Protein CFT1 [Wickerhamiella sorbophila]|uniref:Protein CFT1 n=1 Tax=Wickerhamiella sorbophila TaxID=45607 RepID=A0A2T0FG53_9ASCO|nr:Protein CFT1 [Wickerhamiella sorbophila]PRT53947.1 Protein CFT1 [Wickerhamiella sorbophila]
MHLYRELTSPTVVTHSVTCNLSSEEESLVVVRGNSLLQVYNLKPVEKVGAHGGDNLSELTLETVRIASKLVFVAEFPMDGYVVSLQKFRRSDYPNDLIVVVFKYAKMVVLAWDSKTMAFEPVSMHYYEGDLPKEHFFNPEFQCKLSVDSSYHSMSLLYQHDRLAMLAFPVLSDVDVLEIPFLPSVLLNAVDLDVFCTNIVDMAYRHGYAEPTLSVLFTPKRTWTGTLGLEKDNVTYIVVSVDMQRRRSTLLSKISNLPYDICQIVPLEESIGGTLLLGANSIVLVDSLQKTGVNEYSSFESELSIDLNQAQICQLPNTSHVLIATQAGVLYDLEFSVYGKKKFKITELTDIDKCFQPTTMSCIGSNLFIGCQGSNAKLFSWSYAQINGTSVVVNDPVDEIDEIYHALETNNVKEGKILFCLDDELASTGPMGALTSLGDTLTVATGYGTSGGFTNLFKTVWPIHRDRLSLGRPHNIWGLGSYLLASFATESRLFRGPDFDPVTVGDFDLRNPTLEAQLVKDNRIVHVHTRGIATYDAQFTKLAHIEFDSEAVIAIASSDVIVVQFEGLIRAYNHSLTEVSASQGQDAIGAFGTQMMSSQAGHVMIGSSDYYFGSFARFVSICNEPVLSDEPVTQVVAAKLGDNILANNVLAIIIGDVLSIYQPSGDSFVKVFATTVGGDAVVVPLNISNYQVLFVTGRHPHILMKSTASPIRCHPFGHRRVVSITTLDTDIVYTDSKYRVNVVSLDEALDYTTSEWPHQKFTLGEPISALAFDRNTNLLLAGCNTPVSREALLDNGQPMEGTKPDASFKGNTFQGRLKLVSPDTGYVYTDFEFSDNEAVVSIEVVTLQMGELADLREDFVVVGTALLLNEDEASNGYFHMFAIKEVHSDMKGYRLEKVSEELVRGAVTGICEIEGGGVVAGQGQKIMMRRYRDVYSIEPVAFYDAAIHIEDLKSLRNLIAVGDAIQGVSLLSAGVEPYRMDLLARDHDFDTKVGCLEFISSEDRNDLHIAIVDINGRLRIDQFDPDTPSSMGGSHLVTQSEIFIGRRVNAMTLVYGEGKSLVPIGGSTDGVLVTVEPLNEMDFKALYVVTEQMADKEQSIACLNPRDYRTLGCKPSPQAVIDFRAAQNFLMLTRDRQLHYSRKLGQHGLIQVFDAITRQSFDF